MTFDLDLDLEHTLDAGLPGVHRVQVWWRSGHFSARRSDLRKSLQTDGQTDRRRTPRHCIWNELKMSHTDYIVNVRTGPGGRRLSDQTHPLVSAERPPSCRWRPHPPPYRRGAINLRFRADVWTSAQRYASRLLTKLAIIRRELLTTDLRVNESLVEWRRRRNWDTRFIRDAQSVTYLTV